MIFFPLRSSILSGFLSVKIEKAVDLLKNHQVVNTLVLHERISSRENRQAGPTTEENKALYSDQFGNED